jgi:Uma2 family endonuclease
MVIDVTRRLINVDEFYKMAEVGILKPADRIELISGEIIEMSPIGSKHAGVVNRLSRLLNKILENKVVVGVQNPVRLDDINEPEPDISVLKYRSDDYSTHHPEPNDILALIEVADSTINYDKEIKIPLYASYKIPLYWIIDIGKDRIEVYTNPQDSDYLEKTTYNLSDEISLLGVELKVKDILIRTDQ